MVTPKPPVMAVQNTQKRRRTAPRIDYRPGYTEDRTFRLSANSRKELAEILNLEGDAFRKERRKCLAEVRRRLSMYPGMVKAYDEAPRPAHTFAFLQPLVEQARTLRHGLRHTEQPVWWNLTAKGFSFDKDCHDLGERLDRFLGAAEAVQEELEGQESRHGRSRTALNYLIAKLTHIFDRYAFVEDVKDCAGLKADFVDVALSAACIPHPRLRTDTAKRRRSSGSRLRRRLGGTGKR